MQHTPSFLKLYLALSRRMLQAHRFLEPMPQLEHSQSLSIQPAHFQEYCSFIGLSDEYIPLTYAYLLAHPSQLFLLAQKEFPLRAAGLIHLGFSAREFSPLSLHEQISIHSNFHDTGWHHKGRLITFESNFYQENTKCISLESTYLAKGSPPSDAQVQVPPPQSQKREACTQIPISFSTADIRRYTKLSADYNPIHLHPLLARLFGFQDQVVHGMHSLGASLAQIEEHQQQKIQYIDCRFIKALFTTSSAQISWNTNGQALLADNDNIYAQIQFQ